MTIADWWDTYEQQVVPATARSVQRYETKRAFYAGVAAMVGLLTELAEEDREGVSTALNAIMDELVGFRDGVTWGNA